MPTGQRVGITPVVGMYVSEAPRLFLMIAAASDQVVVAEGERLHVLSSYGEQRWSATIPAAWRRSVVVPPPPVEMPTRQSSLRKLGIEGSV
jgi:hypothetical protein